MADIRPILVFGARPNFMKIAPVYRRMLERSGFEPLLVHTGQHFESEMSEDFIEALELPQPDFHLEVGPGSQTWQLGEIMHRLEPVFERSRPDITVVVGDVNSTLAAALTSAALEIPVAHVEAGLRSRDWRMPEERNRVLTDRLSRYLFTPSADADKNLQAEGIEEERIVRVGNVMIDSLDWVLPRVSGPETRRSFGVGNGPYGLVTLHRPSNVDEPLVLEGIVRALTTIAAEIPLLFPVHPRTRDRLRESGLNFNGSAVRDLLPLGYRQFIALLEGASLVMTDSGGIQEEATVLGIPCVTLRENTERPITIAFGSNRLVGSDRDRIVAAALQALESSKPRAARPPMWDGRTAERIVDELAAGAEHH